VLPSEEVHQRLFEHAVVHYAPPCETVCCDVAWFI
jgi:hypothetical protein